MLLSVSKILNTLDWQLPIPICRVLKLIRYLKRSGRNKHYWIANDNMKMVPYPLGLILATFANPPYKQFKPTVMDENECSANRKKDLSCNHTGF